MGGKVMPIEYRIDSERRIVIAKGYGTFTHEDVLRYQQEVWSRPELAGYDELVDMSHVELITLSSTERLREVARLSARMDTHALASRFAIVAPTDLAFGLGRMYEAYRSLDEHSTRQVGVFRSLDEACEFLGLSGI
jgi:hypothetical protein